MIYIDTSVAVTLLVPEAKTADVEAWFADLNETPAASDWLLTEFASAISIKERIGELTQIKAAKVRKEFEYLCAGLRIAPVSRSAFHAAAQLASKHKSGLRAGDALHLAVAKELGATTLATLDSRMAANAKGLGIALETI